MSRSPAFPLPCRFPSSLLIVAGLAIPVSASPLAQVQGQNPSSPSPSSSAAVAFVYFCEPGVDAISCPCGNPPTAALRGCNNFGSMTGGAYVTAAGNASLSNDTLTISVGGENSSAFTIIWQGHTLFQNPPYSLPYGAGVRCVQGGLKRMYLGNVVGGGMTRPAPGEISISLRSEMLGDPIYGPNSPGPSRFYFTIYRDPMAAVPCGSPVAVTNLSNTVAVSWAP